MPSDRRRAVALSYEAEERAAPKVIAKGSGHVAERILDIARKNANEHLAFGNGPHVCLGKRVAIMQLDTAYQNILRRFPNIRWTGKSSLAPSNFVHAISTLEVDLDV